MIDIWQIDLDAYSPHPYPADELTDEEQAYVARMATDLLRRRAWATRAATRNILARYLELPARQVSLMRLPHGRPCLHREQHAASVLDFNLSHAQSRMVMAVSDRYTVGIDLESVDRRVDPERLAKAVFAPSDYEWFRSFNDLAAFLRIWTAKEAVLKLLGTGLQIPAPLVELNWEQSTATIHPAAKYFAGQRVHLHPLLLTDEVIAHLATYEPIAGDAIQFKVWTRPTE